ncbi:MAG TPA: NADH-quinone oxidoreductase subunit J [Kofleriaceae bacterium]|nr:NADH-quinone oxidoreductase subunit J [Kofleriaceae bacterium]
MRGLVIAAALLLALVGLTARAHAQAQPPQPVEAKPAPHGAPAPEAHADAPGEAAHDEGTPVGFQNSRLAALFFWVLAGLTIAGSLFVITRRNLIAAVMGMVGTFFALAGLYAMLYAHFLAAIQVLVYAGAIMVLFVFVVMILNRPEDEPWALQGLLGKALATLGILYLVFRLSGVLWGVKDTPHAAITAPTPTPAIVAAQGGAAEHPAKAAPINDDFGSTRAVGKVLFREYLFPFEAVSLILLVAVVGGLAIARPHHREVEEHGSKAA